MRITARSLLVATIALSGLPTGAGSSDQSAPAVRHLSPEIRKSVEAADYGKVRIKKFPIAVQCWTFRKFTFFDTLQKVRALGVGAIQAYPGQPLGTDLPGVRFDHSMTGEAIEKVRAGLKAAGVQVVAYGVVDLGTTEESMRHVFDFARKLGIRTIVTEPAEDGLDSLEKLVQETGVRIAIHNHPEPSKYARPETVLQIVRGRDERIGSCADTGHWMRGMVDPREALKFLEGRIVDVHLKDRSGLGVSGVDDVPWGSGRARIRDLLAELTLQDYGGYLTVEYENEQEAGDPGPAVDASIRYVNSITHYEGYERIFRRSGNRYEKHGWNHYGPGYFEVDPKTGVLKGQGGMGLLWYSARKYRDFILELEYMCAQEITNSGIFLRVPEVPSNDDYIYRSFEIQIYDAGQGIHKTGAVYDVQAPSADAFLPTGEWNHLRIQFQGKRLKVEVNGKPVQDWDAHPGGKVRDFSLEGYIGLQNHDSAAPVYFRNIHIKEL
ncbi:MAG: DUF1080 domain-containing protein [Acidobacteria bacterium]|nr:DUF1080 domain-containing protein [Acidobacteriota bacterium]